MRRREFISLLATAAAAWPLAARAQQPSRTPLVGVLMGTAQSDPEGQSYDAAFRQALQRSGWRDGTNVRIENRWSAADVNLARTYAAELVALKPDVIVGHVPVVVTALQRATSTIPIVFVQVPDPVGYGYVSSFSRPGGNITGFTHFDQSMGGKWLQLLKQIAPNVTRAAVLLNPVTVCACYLPPVLAAGSSYAIEPIETPVHNPAEIEHAIIAFAQMANGGLVVLPDITTIVHREPIIRLAAQLRTPAIYAFRFFAADGGLMSYGVNQADLFRRAAPYVDRILRGEKPSDLPVQSPTTFELVINVKTAKALGLTVPPTLLATANEVIE